VGLGGVDVAKPLDLGEGGVLQQPKVLDGRPQVEVGVHVARLVALPLSGVSNRAGSRRAGLSSRGARGVSVGALPSLCRRSGEGRAVIAASDETKASCDAMAAIDGTSPGACSPAIHARSRRRRKERPPSEAP